MTTTRKELRALHDAVDDEQPVTPAEEKEAAQLRLMLASYRGEAGAKEAFIASVEAANIASEPEAK